MPGNGWAAPAAVVSPHLDDGVFACGAFLGAHPGSVVVTLFAGHPAPGPVTEWDRSSGFGPGDDVIGRRREEDLAALTRLGARHRWLEFLDAQYGAPAPPAALAAALEQALVEERARTVLIPLGLFHDDHRAAHAAGLAVACRRPEWSWFAYEDALYRTIDGERNGRLAELAARGFQLEPATLAVQPELKPEAVACYRSQLRALSTPGRPGTADVAAPERFWRIRW